MSANRNAAPGWARGAAQGTKHITRAEIIAQFAEAIQAAGIDPPDRIIDDGRLHRFSTNGKRKDDAGWYVLHSDGVPAGAFGDWRSGISEKWCANLGRRLNPAEQAEVRRRIEEARAEAEAERRKRAKQAAELASAIWQAAEACTEHPYLRRKGVAPVANLRVLPVDEFTRRAGYAPQARGEPLEGMLLIAAVKTREHNPSTLELIDENGRKSALAGGVKGGGYWTTGPLPTSGRVVIAEGIATALSIAQALGGEPVAAALSVGNLRAAGETIRTEHPGVQLVIAADLGEEGPHPEAVKAAEALRCPLAIPPADLGKGGDFNDLHVRDGLEAVRTSIESAEPPRPALSEAAMPRDEALRLAREALMPERNHGIQYPVHALGPLAGVAERIAQGVQCDPALAGQSVLGAVALLAQSIANVRTLDGAVKPLSLYLMTIASSGDGKDSADRIALRPIIEWQREAARAYEHAQKEKKKEKGESGDKEITEPFRIAADVTIEGLRRSFQKGMPSQGIFSTEAGTLLAGHAMNPENRVKTASALCGLWEKGHLSVSRVGTGRLEKFGLRLSMHLLVQPAAALEALSDDALAGIGFWPRFLHAWPAPLPPRKFRPFRPDQDPVIAHYWERMAELLRNPVIADLDGLPVLEMSEAAQSRLAEFFEEAEYESRLGEWQSVKPFGLRATELAARIAGVLTIYAGGSEIDETAIENAVTLVRYSLANWRAALEDGRADPIARHAFTLYRWLLEYGEPIKRGDILRLGPSALRSKSRRDEAIERLEAAGLIVMADDRLAANPAPVHLRQRPLAKTANLAKNSVDAGFSVCEPFAKTANESANAQAGNPAIRKIRKDSQAFANGESRVGSGFSQDSQLSQTPVSAASEARAGGDPPAIRKDSQAFASGECHVDSGFSQDSQLSQTPVSEVNAEAEARSVLWRLHFADREPFDVVYAEPMNRADVLAIWPGAADAEPLKPTESAAGVAAS